MEIILKTVKFGTFTLSSGKVSDFYVDIKGIISNPSDLKEIVSTMGSFDGYIDRVCGVPMGAIPLATAYSIIYNVPQITLRDSKKTYGTAKQIEGEWKVGEQVLLIDDVWTTGKSMMAAREKLENAGLEVDHMVVVLCREENSKLPHGLSYCEHISTLRKSSPFVMKKHLHERGKTCFAADCPIYYEVDKYIARHGTQVAVVKIHPDIICDWDDDCLASLISRKEEDGFKIWVDLKLCDVPHIMVQQMKKYHWADIISVMSIVGVDALMALDSVAEEVDIDLFVVDSLFTGGEEIWSDPKPTFTSKLWDRVIGTVGAKKHPGFLHVRAGVGEDDPDCDLVVRGRSLMDE